MRAAGLLRQARSRRGLSQAELAARAGTSQPVISAYEHGRRDPSTQTLGRLIAATGERLELRLAPHPPEVPPPTGPQEHATRLVDVLRLADAVPRHRRGRMTMPRMVSSS
jgi:transcriptional regulator with XRE-family HTH domain